MSIEDSFRSLYSLRLEVHQYKRRTLKPPPFCLSCSWPIFFPHNTAPPPFTMSAVFFCTGLAFVIKPVGAVS